MESMSSYARQFIEQIGKPSIEKISGISPTVAIEQRVTGTKKSTVGSITEIAQFLKDYFTQKLGVQLSINDGNPLSIATESQIATNIDRALHQFKPTKKYPTCFTCSNYI